MSDNKKDVPEKEQYESDTNIAASAKEVPNVATSVKSYKQHGSSSERQMKFERAQKCLENAALVSKRIKEHRKATAELLGRPFEDDYPQDNLSEITSAVSDRTGFSVATDTSTTLSVQDALNIPGISESLANTLKQKELLMEKIKQYKEISKKPVVRSLASSKTDLTSASKLKADGDTNLLKEKENALSILQVKLRAMETTVLDLQEKITEKDQIIEAKNKATTLMSDNLSKKEKDSMMLLEDTRQQMTKMQENFIAMEAEWKEEKEKLLKDIENKDDKIKNLEEATLILENSRFETSVANSKLTEELDKKSEEVITLQNRLQEFLGSKELSQKDDKDIEEEKGTLEISNMVELSKKIELLEQINCQIRQTNKELESKLAAISTDHKPTSSSPVKSKGSPLPQRKGRNTSSKMKSPWSQISSESLPQETDKKVTKNEIVRLEMLVQSLNKDILDKEYLISHKDSQLLELQNLISHKEKAIQKLELDLISIQQPVPKSDIGIITESLPSVQVSEEFKQVENLLSSPELETKLKRAEDQITALNNEVDIANKNMIKVKSGHKLKLKQMQKTIDSFSKVSDSNAEIVKLNEELHQLSHKVAELEEEKGNLQLHLVDYDSGRLTDSDVYKKMIEMENLAEVRLKAISLLETQKFDLVQELHVIQQKNIELEDKLVDISEIQNEQVSSEIKSVQLEETIDKLISSKKELELVIDNLKHDKDSLSERIKLLSDEKDALNQKLEHYIQENMELTDKLEKLSAEKVSSAESIEIVESLTTQEKLEIEEYNKNISDDKFKEHSIDHSLSRECTENVGKLVEESAELNKKIELFTQERQEVMERLNKISAENKSLHSKIDELSEEAKSLQNNITVLKEERNKLNTLNEELGQQIENLKRERVDILKESADTPKPSSIEDVADAIATDTANDDKTVGEKSLNRNKSLKQLTKEILKLKNIIKEREAEIGDCQMKILSLEEQQQKQLEMIQKSVANENRSKQLLNENNKLKDEINQLQNNHDQQDENKLLRVEIQKIQNEYVVAINSRDSRIQELENVLIEYENQITNYNSALQQKDKEITEYVNQITKLNDVSQKLKSTIEMLEEEKAKDQHADLVKSLNKQIASYQKKLTECEEKIRLVEEDKIQLLNMKNVLEAKNLSLEAELRKTQDAYVENQNLIKDLQFQNQKHVEEMKTVKSEGKERDEEIHEIKLQLRKESIENEKLRTALSQKELQIENVGKELNEIKDNLRIATETKYSLEEYTALENINKELLEKLKKLAANIKKKSGICTDLENQVNDLRKEMNLKNHELEQFSMQISTLSALEEKYKVAEEEINRLQLQKSSIEQELHKNLNRLKNENSVFDEKLKESYATIQQLNDSIYVLQEDNKNLKNQIESVNNRLVEFEIEQKNSSNYVTKISTLEAELVQKHKYVTDLLSELESERLKNNQIQYGHEAKVQERDLYIENLETEINNYKNRIYRLENSISAMEDRRHSLERKADQLDTQLQEKQKAYAEYSSQEDELVKRLAILMDHDRVIEKQLCEIDNENKDMQTKIHNLNDENQKLHSTVLEIQDQCRIFKIQADKCAIAESEASKFINQLQDAENNLKRLAQEKQALILQNKHDIEELETEFNTQIENTIREKKILNEKFEKSNDSVTKLENSLVEYKNIIENLNGDLKSLATMNQELTEKLLSSKDHIQAPDYTEQYIEEINKLNSIINSKNGEILECNTKLQAAQSNNLTTIANYESYISDLNNKIDNYNAEINKLKVDFKTLSEYNEHLQATILETQNQVDLSKHITEAEGKTVLSNVETIRDNTGMSDILGLEAQIISDVDYPDGEANISKKDVALVSSSSEGVVEPVIVPKKSYLCYTAEDNPESEQTDPFNSDEGWGLGDNDETLNIVPGLTHLNTEISQLKKDNESLKNDWNLSNTKLQKALKKLKELKASNDMLSKELKISKQVSSSSFLDSAIEIELKDNITELEKKIGELNAELIKERKEKESVKKQNDVFITANERLTDMKEKLDNEILLWKYKFKETNDKISSFQWDADAKDSPKHKIVEQTDSQLKEELTTLEKENEELQSMLDQMSLQNKELNSEVNKMKHEINKLNTILHSSNTDKDKFTETKANLDQLKENYDNLTKCNEQLNQNISVLNSQYCSLKEQLDITKSEFRESQTLLENKVKEYNAVCLENKLLVENIEDLKLHMQSGNTRVKTSGNDELLLSERHGALEESCLNLTTDLNEAHNRIKLILNENQDLQQKCSSYEVQVSELESKLLNLNTENDQLLSTVTELRSSISSAVDQRGYEIAELWKQHLAQRETDFQKSEHELKLQLSAAEHKYEQLLDNVQSSSQEETNKLVTLEQMSSLQAKLQDKEDHLHNLQDRYSEALTELDMLRSEMEDEKVMHESKLLTQQEEFEKQIKDLGNENEKQSKNFDSSFKSLQDAVSLTKTSNDDLQQQVQDLTDTLKQSESKILELTNHLLMKDDEIHHKVTEYTVILKQRNDEFDTLRQQLVDYEKKIEDLAFEKESELAYLRLKMHEEKEYYEKERKDYLAQKTSLEEALNDKIVECTTLNKQITQLNQQLEEHSNRSGEMQAALENQEFEIVTLKDEIARLQEAMRASSSKIEKHVSFAATTKPGADYETDPDLDKELLEAVPRAELDLAMYMLHQRDVRCEELTMELTQLLEERDTLQIRLSDSLRSYEDLKSRCISAGLNVVPETSIPSLSVESTSFSVEKESQFVDTHRRGTSRSSSVSDHDGDKPNLQAKLSELRSVKHSRDYRIRQESEQRQLGMRLLQRDVANLPPEAVGHLAQAHHTLSRDSQSTPTVLLNWLRGKSTPKVVHM